MGFYINVTFTINLGTIALLAFASAYISTILPLAYALNYDNYGEDDDFGEENIDQTLQQDDISNTPQSSSDLPTAGCDMDTFESPEESPSCIDDDN
jgi:hypothetical protein